MSFIYLIKNTEESHYKIGVGKNPTNRLKQLQTGSSSELVIVHTFETDIPYVIEKTLHRQFSHKRKHGEWFDFSINEETDFIKNCQNIESHIKLLREMGNSFLQ
jgi:hypothetical protein